MRNGHFTQSDIETLTVNKPTKKGISQTATCKLKDGCQLWSDGLTIQIHSELASFDGRQDYNDIRKVPEKYKVVAELVRKKASKHGGYRIGAGRTESDEPTKKTRSFRLTAYEYIKVKEFIENLRKE